MCWVCNGVGDCCGGLIGGIGGVCSNCGDLVGSCSGILGDGLTLCASCGEACCGIVMMIPECLGGLIKLLDFL